MLPTCLKLNCHRLIRALHKESVTAWSVLLLCARRAVFGLSSIWLARELIEGANSPDELHGCVCVVATSWRCRRGEICGARMSVVAVMRDWCSCRPTSLDVLLESCEVGFARSQTALVTAVSERPASKCARFLHLPLLFVLNQSLLLQKSINAAIIPPTRLLALCNSAHCMKSSNFRLDRTQSSKALSGSSTVTRPM